MANFFKKIIKGVFGGSENNSAENKDNKHFAPIEEVILKGFIHEEATYQNQRIVIRRATELSRLTLGELLNQLFDTDRSSVLSMAVAYREAGVDDSATENIVEDPDYIWDFDLFSCVLKRKNDEGHYTDGMLHETTLIVKTKERGLVLVLSSRGGTSRIKYMRVSVLAHENTPSYNTVDSSAQNPSAVISFVLSYCEDENDPDFQIYSDVIKSLHEKKNKKSGLNELEQECIYGMAEFKCYDYIGYGKWLYDQDRYYDAFSILQRAFSYMNSRQDWADEEIVNVFCAVCNMIGGCLTKMCAEDEAAYYYRLGAPGLTLEGANYLALSLARLGNPVAVEEMKTWLDRVSQKYGDCKHWPEAVIDFSANVPAALIRYKKAFDEKIKVSPAYSEGITIGYVLSAICRLNKNNLFPCMFAYDIVDNKFLDRLSDIDAIFDYRIDSESAANKVFVLSCTHSCYNTNDSDDKSILCSNAPLVIATHSVVCEEGSSDIQVDVMQHNFSGDDDKRSFDLEANFPPCISFIIGHPLDINYVPDKDRLSAAMEKAADLMREKRIAEAFKLAKWTYECTSNLLKDASGVKFESDDCGLWTVLFNASYIVGFCLMEFHMMQRAAYYLEMAHHGGIAMSTVEYVNCMANCRDPRALELINKLIGDAPKPESNDDVESWRVYMAFLKRRKAYVLVDREQYAEARSLLSELLADPMCEDFAKQELMHLNNLEKGKC